MKLMDLVEGQSDYDFFRSSADGTSAVTTPTNVLQECLIFLKLN